MRKIILITLSVVLWLTLSLYFVRLTQFKKHVDEIAEVYQKHAEDLGRSISYAYFQWDEMYDYIFKDNKKELEKWFEILKEDFPLVEKIEVVDLDNPDFEVFSISASDTKLVYLMRVCNDEVAVCLPDKGVLLVADAQILLDDLGVRHIKIDEQGNEFAFGLRYKKLEPIMDSSSWMLVLSSGMAALFLSVFIESRRKMKALEKESTLMKIQQAIVELMSEYLKKRKIEELYQLLLEKAVEAIPNAQAGSVLVKKGNKYVYVASVGYDLEKLSKVTFPVSKTGKWLEKDSIKRADDIMGIDQKLPKENLEILINAGRLKEIKCSMSFAVEIEGEPVVIFNLDNFEREDAFNEETRELARIFAMYFGVMFEHATLEEELEKERIYLEYLSTHDPLTGLMNRTGLEEYGGKMLPLAKRQGKRVTVMFMDLKGFKQLNDRLGHKVGDDVLRIVGSRLEKVMRQGDMVARFGGDEFVIFVYDCDKECVERLAKRIFEALESPIELENDTIVSVTGNIGVAIYPEDAEDLDLLIRNADMAMYQAKQNGLKLFFYSKMKDRQEV